MATSAELPEEEPLLADIVPLERCSIKQANFDLSLVGRPVRRMVFFPTRLRMRAVFLLRWVQVWPLIGLAGPEVDG